MNLKRTHTNTHKKGTKNTQTDTKKTESHTNTHKHTQKYKNTKKVKNPHTRNTKL